MKNLPIILLIFCGFAAFSSGEVNKLNIGDKAQLTDLRMKDVAGKEVSLADAKNANGILVLFSANTCPFANQWEGRYPELKAWAEQNKVGFVVLNSNHNNRDGVDSFDEMKKRANDKSYNFNYLFDADSKIANAFGAQTTPHAFLFDKDWKLVYKGAIDDNYESAKDVKHTYVKDAIAQMASGKKVSVDETKPVGCGIKRKTD